MTFTNVSLRRGYGHLPKVTVVMKVFMQIADAQACGPTRFKRSEHAVQLGQRLGAQTGHPKSLNTQITYSLSPYPEKLKPTLHLDLVFKRNPTQYPHPATVDFPFHANQKN